LIASTRRTRLIVDASAPDDAPGPAPGTDRTPSLIRPTPLVTAVPEAPVRDPDREARVARSASGARDGPVVQGGWYSAKGR
jgi:hypothetical protein